VIHRTALIDTPAAVVTETVTLLRALGTLGTPCTTPVLGSINRPVAGDCAPIAVTGTHIKNKIEIEIEIEKESH